MSTIFVVISIGLKSFFFIIQFVLDFYCYYYCYYYFIIKVEVIIFELLIDVVMFFLFFFQVSWIRKRDLHILTVGILTYTNDQRFQAMHSDGSDEWTLKITSPQVRDSGTYECQVSTEPKISQAYRLSVVGQ